MFVCDFVWPSYLANEINALVCEGNAHGKQITQ